MVFKAVHMVHWSAWIPASFEALSDMTLAKGTLLSETASDILLA